MKKTIKVTEEDLKEYVKKEIRNNPLCRDILLNMFTWDISIPQKFIESMLISCGKCAFWKHDDELIVTNVTFLGDINVYGIGKDAFCVTKNGIGATFEDWINNKDVVICFNNSAWNNDYEADITQELLNESNISIKCDTIGTRFSKIFKAKNEVEKANIESAIEANANGVPQVIVGAPLGELIGSEFDATTETMEVSELKSSDRLQYVTKQKDDIWKWFLNLYGLSALSNVKMAQQTSDEINNQLFSSFVLPISKLESRLSACDDIKNKFGISCSVKFSKCWELSYERILNANNISNDNENLADDTTDTADIDNGGENNDVQENK